MKRRDFLMAATGVAGGGAAGATAAAAQETTTTSSGNTTASENETTTAANGTTTSGGSSGGGGPTEEVIVGPGGSLVYEPADLTIAPGTTVNFVWESDNHNIVVDSQPDDANWEGTAGSETQTYDTGHEYSYTFETEGTFEYFCEPHKQTGMTGTITVTPDAGESESSGPAIPSSAKTLGIATTVVMAATLGLTYVFMRYGGDYETPGE